MTRSRAIRLLSLLIAALATVLAVAGLLWGQERSLDAPVAAGTDGRDDAQGCCLYDTRFTGWGSKGTHVVALVLGVPLMVGSTACYRRDRAA